MNKAQLIEAIAADANMTKASAKRSLDSFMKVAGSALSKGDKITLVGFGSFAVTKKPGRIGRNPRTGSQIKIAPKNMVKFKAGSELNHQVR